MRQIEFVADAEGDWAFHCHKSHHTMNAMGHGVPAMIGVDHRGLAGKINKLIPDYMVMGERGMADMAQMEMPLPDNTLPMMTGQGPFGSVERGGMSSMMKVRRDQKRGDYSDPGGYKQPPGTQAHEVGGAVSNPPDILATNERRTMKSILLISALLLVIPPLQPSPASPAVLHAPRPA